MSNENNTLSVEQEIVGFKRRLLKERLGKMPAHQTSLFNRIFPEGTFPDNVPENKLVQCIDLCDRTIRKNEKNPERLAARSGERK